MCMCMYMYMYMYVYMYVYMYMYMIYIYRYSDIFLFCTHILIYLCTLHERIYDMHIYTYRWCEDQRRGYDAHGARDHAVM